MVFHLHYAIDKLNDTIENNIDKKDPKYKILKNATKSELNFADFLDEKVNLVANYIKYFDSTKSQSLSKKN